MSFLKKAGKVLDATKTFAAKSAILSNKETIQRCNSMKRQLANEYRQAETKSQRQEIVRKHENVVNARNDAAARIEQANNMLNKDKKHYRHTAQPLEI